MVVDRERTCPLLLRTFLNKGGHRRQEDYAVRGKEPLDDEVQIYSWMDATLRELSDLIKEASPAARERNSQLSFAIAYPDKRGTMTLKEVGITHALRRGMDDEKTLAMLHFSKVKVPLWQGPSSGSCAS